MRFGVSPDGELVLMAGDQGGEVVICLTRSAEDALHEVMLKRRLEREPAGPPDEPTLINGDA